MARYIDADKLIEALQIDFKKEGAKADDMAMSGNADLSVKYSHGQFCYLNAIERIKDVPTADVVPRAVVTEIAEYLERHLSIKRKQVDIPFSSRDMRNYQCGAIDVIEYLEDIPAELKKKYIGDKR